jgi:hypothetical protein
MRFDGEFRAAAGPLPRHADNRHEQVRKQRDNKAKNRVLAALFRSKKSAVSLGFWEKTGMKFFGAKMPNPISFGLGGREVTI